MAREQKPRRTRPPAENQSQRRALLDFGASGARALLVEMTPDGAEVLGYGTAAGKTGFVEPGHAVRRDVILRLAETALTAAEQETTRYNALPAIADAALVCVSGPLLETVPVVLDVKRERPRTPLSAEEFERAWKRICRRVIDRVHELETEDHVRRRLVTVEFVGAAVGSRQLVTFPGPAGTTLSVAACGFTWPETGLDVLHQVVADLELELMEVVPALQAVARVLPVAEAVLVDVGQVHTAIGLVEHHRLSRSADVLKGGHFFTARIRAALRISERAAEVAKRQYALGHGAPDARARLADVLEAAVEDWADEVEQVLIRLAASVPLPPRIYIFGGGGRLPEILSVLRRRNWTSPLPFPTRPAVDRLLPNRLHGTRDPHGLLQTPEQVAIAALAAWTAYRPDDVEEVAWRGWQAVAG
ncbi:MAG: hypothetical protein Q9O62_09800 [Ardenticatenia bacterium]|nr:hypothetical protein [Ardenticatenia bacterium]